MTQSTKWVIGVLVVVAIIAVAYGAYNKKGGAPVEAAPIKIGLSSPMTGEAASYGEGFSAGAELAVREINEAGGINGSLIELIIEDDQCSAKGVNAVSKLVTVDAVTAIVGPMCSAAAGPGLPIAQNAGVPVIVVGSAPHLTKVGDYIFRDYPSDAFQGKFAAEFLYNDLGKRKAAIIYTKNDWGMGIQEVFAKRFVELGGEVVYNEGVVQDSTDLRTQLTKAKEAGPDVLYFPVYPQNGAAGFKQAKELGLEATIVGGDSFDGEETWQIAEAEGMLYTTAKMNNSEEFYTKIKTITGKNANVFSAYAYDGIKIFAHVLSTTGTDQKAIQQALTTLSYTGGVSSPIIEFDENGDLKAAEFEVKVIKAGKAEIYQ